ncbi:MAG: GNAT family N-acetyltransferase [Streptosporangiales bacterium]|nr:GNAT family N-acetyltransferase [Streptosporangiales bacterium]MBO0889982.1 GNAT family N-acetyltransferase [Acidothermales bacterium]
MPPELVVRPASTDELRRYVELRDDAARHMLATGIDQWRPGQLDADGILEWVGDGEVFAAYLGAEMVGGMLVMWSDPLFWGDHDGAAAGYTHGLLVDRRYKGRGLGRRLLAFAEGRIEAAGRRLARLDTVSGNAVLRAYYRDAGYREAGERVFHDDAPVDAVTLFEKPL